MTIKEDRNAVPDVAVRYVIFMQKVQFCFALSGKSLTFTIEFRRHWGGVWKDFTEKSAIEINNL